MSMRDYLDRRRQNKEAAQVVPKVEAPVPPVPKPSVAGPRPQKVVLAKATFKCGCVVGEGYFKGNDCPACVARKRAEKNRARKEGHEEKKALKGRLPDSSTFVLAYDAVAALWTGTLAIITESGLRTFQGQATSVVRLLGLLDGLYRLSLPPVPSPSPIIEAVP